MTHPHLAAQCRIDTPLGTMTAAASDKGIAGLWFDDQAHHPGELDAPVNPGLRWLKSADAYLRRYFEADWPAQRSLPLDLHGTAFQRAVWQALLALPAGQTSTYAAIAAQAGSPAGVRAAGAAVGRNPVSVLVPCHRVVGADGSLTGYAGGLERKRALLLHEGVPLVKGLDKHGVVQQTVPPVKPGRAR